MKSRDASNAGAATPAGNSPPPRGGDVAPSELAGLLPAALLHELANVVASAGLCTEVVAERQRRLWRSEAVDPGQVRELQRLMRSCGCALAHARRLCRHGLAFFDPHPRAEPIDLVVEVQEACDVALPHCVDRITLDVQCEPVPQVRGRPGLVFVVVLNLVLNAVDSIGPAARGQVRVHTCRQGEEVLIAVDDSGGGISAELQQRIFEPLYSTKPHGGGRGIGLYVVREAVARLGGSVAVTSVVGQGSRFEVSLPVG